MDSALSHIVYTLTYDARKLKHKIKHLRSEKTQKTGLLLCSNLHEVYKHSSSSSSSTSAAQSLS